ncbi:MAG: hypothetical protein KAY66_04610, partial [Neisseria sp.]|nr:hypothetical protein [Neisseria sp.]
MLGFQPNLPVVSLFSAFHYTKFAPTRKNQTGRLNITFQTACKFSIDLKPVSCEAHAYGYVAKTAACVPAHQALFTAASFIFFAADSRAFIVAAGFCTFTPHGLG